MRAAGWRRQLYPRELVLLEEWLRVIPLADVCNAIAEDTQKMAAEGGVRSLGFWRWRMSKMVDAALAHRRVFLAPLARPQQPEINVANELDEIARAVPWPEVADSVRTLVDLPIAEVETSLERIEEQALARAKRELEGPDLEHYEEEISQALRACSSRVPPESLPEVRANLEKQILRSLTAMPVFSVFVNIRNICDAA